MSKRNIWTVVLLVGGYIACQIIADIGATKLIQIGSIVMPAGTFIFAITFTLRDMIHKRLGKEWARAAIICAAVFNLVMAGYLALMAVLPSPPFYQYSEAWAAIFALVPSIVLASITAEVISEWTDTEIYHFWRNRFAKAPQWTRVLVSNAVSLPLDSFIFTTLAFVVLPKVFGGHLLPVVAIWPLMLGQIIFKGVVTLISMPGIYLVKEKPIGEEGPSGSL